MKFPSKVTWTKDSIIGKFPVILNELKTHDMSPSELYFRLVDKFEGIDEFVDCLDCLYCLRFIAYVKQKGILVYAG